jgi:uncharacterized cupin superfamily protein
MGKGGSPRHVHHAQDEWFYVVEGKFAAEVGDEKFLLKPVRALVLPNPTRARNCKANSYKTWTRMARQRSW